MRLATWNVERLPSRPRRARVLEAIAAVDADVWVLTETDDRLSPGPDFAVVASGPPDRPGRDDERWVTIASRFPIVPVGPLSDPARSAAALVRPPGRTPLVVFGGVLPWRGSAWRGSGGVAAYLAALEAQRDDWGRLQGEHPDAELVVAGDLNQDLSDRHYYWSAAAKEALREALASVGLVALTADPGDPVRAVAPARASIDHLCVPAGSVWAAARCSVWPAAPAPDRTMSDHYGVVADILSRPRPRRPRAPR